MSRAITLAAIVVLWAVPAWAQPKTDVVTLTNGDRITGEISSLSRGQLEFKTDDAGTIEIEWDNVATLRSVHQFEIITSNGFRTLGSLGAGTTGVLVVVGVTGVVSLPFEQVTGITPIGASFWAKLEGLIDAGFSYTRSSGVAQATLNSSTIYRRPDFIVRLTGSATVTETEDSEPDDRASLDFSYVRYRGLRWYISGGGRLESNKSLGLALRTQAAGAAGWLFVNTNRAQVDGGGGLVANQERGVDTEPTKNLEGLLYFRSSYYQYDRPKTIADFTAQYFPSLSHLGRQRLQVDSSLKREIWKDFTFTLNLYVSFDSDPPTEGAARTDIGITTTAGWTY